MGRSVSIDDISPSGGPRQQEQVAVTRIMIRVLMGGRDRLDVSERSAGQEQLAGCSIPSIDDINRIADDQCIGRLVAWLGRRALCSAEQYESRFAACENSVALFGLPDCGIGHRYSTSIMEFVVI